MNRQLFRRAYRDLLKGESITGTSIEIPTGDAEADKVLRVYKNIIKALPFPLGGIKEDIKYLAIKGGIDSKLSNIETWVNKGLCFKMSSGRTLRIKGYSYNISEAEEKVEKDIANYLGNDVFDEFIWVYNRLSENKSLKDFYKVFMKDEMIECKHKNIQFAKKLTQMLDGEEVRLTGKTEKGRIIDSSNGNTYILDIFKTEYDTGEQEEEVEIRGRSVTTKMVPKKEVYYDFNLFMKREDCPMVNIEEIPYWAVVVLCEYSAYKDELGKADYEGVVIGDTAYFSMNEQVFKVRPETAFEPELVSENSRILGYNKERVYLVNRLQKDGIIHDVIYDADTLEICKERIYKG